MLTTLLALTLAAAEPLPLPPPALAEPAAATPVRAAAPAPPPLELPSAAPGAAAFALPALALLALAVAAFLAARRQRTAPRLVRLIESTSLGPKRSLSVARLGDELLILGVSEAGIQLLATRAVAPEQAAATDRLPAPAAAAGGAPGAAEPPAQRPLRALTHLETRLEELASQGLADPADRAEADAATAQAADAIRRAGEEQPAGRLRALFGRLTGREPRTATRPAPTFDALLAESAEDEELRRKLSMGLSGSVR